MIKYAEIGHQYVCDYSLNPTLTWVLTMSPLMTEILEMQSLLKLMQLLRVL